MRRSQPLQKRLNHLKKRIRKSIKSKEESGSADRKISGYTADEAKEELLKILKDEVKSQALEISKYNR